MKRAFLALGPLLLLGAALRFTGLSAGLRHVPHLDERYFVENVGWMLAERDFDHRFQEYPGFFFYLLAPVLAFFGPPAFGASGYLAARAVVAAFGVASIGLVYALGVRLASPRAALLAAALVAVSPVEVFTAHEVRPDVVLEAFVLLAFLAFLRVGHDARQDGLSGLALGAATAVKFSGVLLVPSYLAQRVLSPGARVRGLVVAGGVSLAAFAALSPYSFLHFGALVDGVRTQVGYHYVPREGDGWAAMALTYLRVLGKALGAPALGLVAIGLVRARPEWRRFVPLALLPVVTIAVFSTAQVHHDRFLVPSLGVVALFAGLALDALPPLAAGLLAVGAVVPPLLASVEGVAGLRAPGTRDQAIDWIEARQPEGSRILTTVEDLGLDRRRYEVLTTPRLTGLRVLEARHMDALVVWAGGDDAPALESFPLLFRANPAFRESGFPIEIRAPGDRPVYESVRLRDEWLRASEGADSLGVIHDGDLATAWRTRGNQRPGDFLQVDLPEPRRLGRIELVMGRQTRLFPRNIHVLVTRDGREWRRVPVVQGRPPVADQVAAAGPPSDVLLVEPVAVRGVRLVQVGERARPWAVAELRLDALP